MRFHALFITDVFAGSQGDDIAKEGCCLGFSLEPQIGEKIHRACLNERTDSGLSHNFVLICCLFCVSLTVESIPFLLPVSKNYNNFQSTTSFLKVFHTNVEADGPIAPHDVVLFFNLSLVGQKQSFVCFFLFCPVFL